MYIEGCINNGIRESLIKLQFGCSSGTFIGNSTAKMIFLKFFQGNFIICFLLNYGNDMLNLRKRSRLLFLFRKKPFSACNNNIIIWVPFLVF